MRFSSEYNFYIPTRFYHGYGRFNQMGKLVKELGNKFLLVTGKQSMKKLGYTEKAVKLLKDENKGVVVYDKVNPNPDNIMIDEGAELAVNKKCDVIIGLGGGSAIDSAKGIAIVAGNGGNIWNYVEEKKSYLNTLPIVAIPTTAGTGSESNCFLVVTNEEKKYKEGIGNDYTFPIISILDPELTENLPINITIDTGIDTLGHSIESYVSNTENATSKILSMNSIWLTFRYLPRVLKESLNKEVRGALMLAASMAGSAINYAGVGAPHGIAMKLGGLFNVTHGKAVGIVLPYSVERSLPKIKDKLNILAEFLGFNGSGDVYKGARCFIDALHNLIATLNFPTKLSEIGIKREKIPEIVNECVGYEDFDNDPMSWSKDEIKEFLEKII